MEIIARHALLTGDENYLKTWTEPIIKACDFIKKSVESDNHDGFKGVMPPAIGTDSLVEVQAIWTQAWCYKGLATSVEFLKKINHPRAAEFEIVRDKFKQSFQSAFEAKTKESKTWKRSDGKTFPVLPDFLLAPPERHIYDDAFLLDTGPLCLPWAGLMDANNEQMIAWADYFREGPPTKLWGARSSSISRAILTHEISSCEPCYSFNIVNSWQTGDREKFLEGMYALFTGAISSQTYINCEHRNNMYGTLFVAPLMTWCMRQAVIDDQLKDDELHLLRLCPKSWISTDEETIFENMPTVFGPASLRWKLSDDQTALNVTFTSEWRDNPGKIVLHVPPMQNLKSIIVNNRAYDTSSREIVLP